MTNHATILWPLLFVSAFVVMALLYISYNMSGPPRPAHNRWVHEDSDRQVDHSKKSNVSEKDQRQRRTCESVCFTNTAPSSSHHVDPLSEMRVRGLKPYPLSRVVPRRVDNNTSHVVPNVVHYVLYSKEANSGKVPFDFQHYLSFRSASYFLEPQYIFLHGDVVPKGKWWARTVTDVDNLYHVYRKRKTTINGVKISYIQHLADYTRLTVIIDYGGIYLDTDMLILKSLDPLRVHKLTLGVSGPQEISNAIIIAQRCALFLRMWLENYHNYVPRIWGYNSVTVGYRLYNLFPHLVHVEKEHLLRPTWKETDLIYSIHNKFFNWSQSYSFHISGENQFKVPKNPEQLKGYNNTLGQVMRYIYFGDPKLLPVKGPPFRAKP